MPTLLSVSSLIIFCSASKCFRIDDFERLAREDTSTSTSSSSLDWVAPGFRVPSFAEAQSLYLCAQWLFSLAQTESAAVLQSMSAAEVLQMQTISVNVMVYAERVRWMFFADRPSGFSCLCVGCGGLIPLENWANGHRVACATCGLHMECCAYTFRPIDTVSPLAHSSLIPRRCTLCSSASDLAACGVPHGPCSGMEQEPFDWLSLSDFAVSPVSCLFCAVQTKHAL